MTNEEHIENLKTIASDMPSNVCADWIESINYAIKALEFDFDKHDEEVIKNTVESIWGEPCEDCISRTKLLAKIDEERKHLLELKMDGAEHIVVHHARRIVEDMPSVIPQSKKGKWVRVDDTKVRCSECDVIHFIAMYPSGEINYCPNCGAKMEEEGDTDECNL